MTYSQNEELLSSYLLHELFLTVHRLILLYITQLESVSLLQNPVTINGWCCGKVDDRINFYITRIISVNTG